MIKLALELYGKATLGCSKVGSILKVVFGEITTKTPHHTTIRNWVIRNGYYALQKPIEKSKDLVGIGDITISLGKTKSLVILGVQMSLLEQRGNYTLKHRDVEILGIHPTEKSTGEFSYKAFEETRNRIGSDFLGIVIDQGQDIKKGLRLYQEQHSNTIIIHDIPHKMSLVMEHALKNNVEWAGFIKKLLETRRLIQQTEFAAMMPPNQRSKARFMDIGYLLDWPDRILESKRSGRLGIIPKETYIKYFGWIEEFELQLCNWRFMVGALDMIKDINREYGLSNETYDYIRQYFENVSLLIDDEKLKDFLEEALKAVKIESDKLGVGETILCSTEVLESIFGKYKELNSGSQGINGNILGLAAFVGPQLTEEGVKETMEKTSTKCAIGWIKEKIGQTLGSLRHHFFKIKRTKFDSDLSNAKMA